jgi:hypothetical protein
LPFPDGRAYDGVELLKLGLWTRIRRPGRAALLLAVGAAGGGAALAVASVPDGGGEVHGCYQVAPAGGTVPVTTPGNFRIIDPSAGQSCSPTPGAAATERALTLGATGPPGPPGATGPTGPPGPPGKTQTIAAGHTFTVAGGGVVTVGGSPELSIVPPTIRSGAHALGQVSVDPGQRDALSFGVLGVSFAPVAKSTGGGGGTGKVAVHELQIEKYVDKSSTKLSNACLTGTHFKTVTIELLKSGKAHIRYTLSSVLVSSYGISPSSGGGTPQETITLNFVKIQITNIPK